MAEWTYGSMDKLFSLENKQSFSILNYVLHHLNSLVRLRLINIIQLSHNTVFAKKKCNFS